MNWLTRAPHVPHKHCKHSQQAMRIGVLLVTCFIRSSVLRSSYWQDALANIPSPQQGGVYILRNRLKPFATLLLSLNPSRFRGNSRTSLRRPDAFVATRAFTHMVDKLTAEDFTNEQKIVLQEPFGTQPIQFVCGNEAGDLDTIVSAMAAAWLMAQDTGLRMISLVPFNRSDFRLRQDAKQLFKDAGFAFQNDGTPIALTFWNEVPWDSLPRSSDGKLATSMTLTDHNKMSRAMTDVGITRIMKIVDHHKDEGLYPEAEREIDTTVGSCCTLLVEALEIDTIPRDLGVLLLGTILVDTRNFDPKERRFNERDKLAVEKLKDFLPERVVEESAMIGVDPQALWTKQLLEARYDVSGLDVQDLLALDYKEATISTTGLRIGFSTVFSSMQELVNLSSSAEYLHSEMQRYGKIRNLAVLICLTQASDLNGVGLVKGLVVSAITNDAHDVAQQIQAYLSNLPETLPDSLKESPLFIKQEVSSKRIVVEQTSFPPLVALWIRPEVTRKTLMPAVLMYEDTR